MGGDVAIWARNEEKNEAARQDLLGAGAHRVETYQVDVSTEEAIVAGMDQVIADFGRIDCAFANAGGPPALAKAQSIRPKSAITWSMPATIASSVETSTW